MRHDRTHWPASSHLDVATCRLLQTPSVDLQRLARAPTVKRTTGRTPTPRPDAPCHVRSRPHACSQHLTGCATTPRPDARASSPVVSRELPEPLCLRLDASGESRLDAAPETGRSLLATCLHHARATASANVTNDWTRPLCVRSLFNASIRSKTESCASSRMHDRTRRSL
jgi:hypothetical protein